MAVAKKNIPCPDCDPGDCLTCDKVSIVSSDDSIKVTKTKGANGTCGFNIRVKAQPGDGVDTENSTTIQLLGDGLNEALKAILKLSSNADNLLEIDSEGLLVLAPSLVETPNSKTDSSSIAITLSGTSNRNIKADIKVSGVSGNALTVQPDGLYVPASSGGGSGNVIHSTSATVILSGAGSSASPLVATVRVSSNPGNDVQVMSDGIFVTSKTHYSLTGADFDTATTYVNPDLAGKNLSVWLLSIGRFIYATMGEINVFPSGGFEVLIPGFNSATDNIEVFIRIN